MEEIGMKTSFLKAALAVALLTAPTVVPETAVARHYHRYYGGHYRHQSYNSNYRRHYYGRAGCSGGNGAVGTVGGGLGGALIGHAVGGTVGTIAGGVGGALLGRTLDKRNTRHRNGC